MAIANAKSVPQKKQGRTLAFQVGVCYNPRMNYTAVTRVSILDGISRTMELPISPAQYLAGMDKWENGALVQDAFPNLHPELREFLKTGITPDQWADLFSDLDTATELDQ